MIVITGSTHDDILYFENVLANKKDIVLLDHFNAKIGTIFNQDVLVVRDLTSSLISSSVMNQILNDYHVDLVINVGRCIGVDKRTRTGDIVISMSVIDGDMDVSTENDVTRFEIPNFNYEYKVQNDIIEYLEKGVKKRPFITYYRALFVSTDNYSLENLTSLAAHQEAIRGDEERMVFDHNSMGINIACFLKGIPSLSIKVIENRFDKENNIDTYLTVLERYIDLGKAVASTIGDVGRNDILNEKGF